MKNIVEKIDEFLEWGGIKKVVVCLVISGIALVVSVLNAKFYFCDLPFDPALIAIILCGIPIVLEAFVGLVTEFDIKADVLVAIALVASIFIKEYFAAAEVAFIMQIGELLEEITVSRARSGIEKLVNMSPRTARVIVDGVEKEIDVTEVKVDDIIKVLPGENIPVDGIITYGTTSINEAVMTGESMPVDKTVNDTVMSGTINLLGAFTMKATKVGSDSSIQRMIQLVKDSDANKAKIVSVADKWATWIVILALTVAIITYFITKDPIRAVTILVVFCPCALVLATPTAIMAGIGNATKYSILVRMGDALEKMASIKKIIFDKTGTLTYGTPKVSYIYSKAMDEKAFLNIVASAESMSEHPLGKAIVQAVEDKTQIKKPESFEYKIGCGIVANVEGKDIYIGNDKLLNSYNIDIDNDILKDVENYQSTGATVNYVAFDKTFAGYIVLSDMLKENAKDTILKIKSMGISPILLTGDNERTAEYITKTLEIKEYKAKCLPEDKLNYISIIEDSGVRTCMIGDGINDAPALKRATVSIAMGNVGSDLAIEAADIVFVHDDIKEIPFLIKLSKRTMSVINANILFSLFLNFVSTGFAIVGKINPIIGALIHNGGALFVIINSVLLLKWKDKL